MVKQVLTLQQMNNVQVELHSKSEGCSAPYQLKLVKHSIVRIICLIESGSTTQRPHWEQVAKNEEKKRSENVDLIFVIW